MDKKYQTDVFKLKELKPKKWWVYRFCGSYQYLSRGWEVAIKQFHKTGLRDFGNDAYYEQYMNDCSMNQPQNLITDIYIGTE